MKKLKRGFLAALCVFCLVLFLGCGFSMEQLWENGREQDTEYYRLPGEDFPEKEQHEIKPPRLGIGQTEPPTEQVQGISGGNYAYELLDETGKQVYDQMLYTILSYKEKTELATTDTKLMREAYQALCADYGGLFWVRSYTYTSYTQDEEVVGLEFAPDYRMDKREKEELQGQVDEVVNEWLGGISMQDSDYEKARYVFETLIENVDYVEGALENQNILSVFLHRETVCQGYAGATQYLLRQLGIPSTIISGRANGEPHAWNLVNLDGSYYYMDTTWGNSTYLNTDSREAKFVNYNFMCMTGEELFLTHEPEVDFPLPECTSMAHNYYVQEGRYFDSWNPDAIGAVFTEAWKNGRSSVAVKVANEELYEQLKTYFVEQQHIADYCDGISSIYYMEAPRLCVFTVNFNEF